MPEFNFFRRDLHSGAKFVAAADHNALAVGKSGKDFNVGAALQAQVYLAFFERHLARSQPEPSLPIRCVSTASRGTVRTSVFAATADLGFHIHSR